MCVCVCVCGPLQLCSTPPSLETWPPSSSRCTPTPTATTRCSTTCGTSWSSTRFPRGWASAWWTTSSPPGPCPKASTRRRWGQRSGWDDGSMSCDWGWDWKKKKLFQHNLTAPSKSITSVALTGTRRPCHKHKRSRKWILITAAVWRCTKEKINTKLTERLRASQQSHSVTTSFTQTHAERWTCDPLQPPKTSNHSADTQFRLSWTEPKHSELEHRRWITLIDNHLTI